MWRFSGRSAVLHAIGRRHLQQRRRRLFPLRRWPHRRSAAFSGKRTVGRSPVLAGLVLGGPRKLPKSYPTRPFVIPSSREICQPGSVVSLFVGDANHWYKPTLAPPCTSPPNPPEASLLLKGQPVLELKVGFTVATTLSNDDIDWIFPDNPEGTNADRAKRSESLFHQSVRRSCTSVDRIRSDSSLAPGIE